MDIHTMDGIAKELLAPGKRRDGIHAEIREQIKEMIVHGKLPAGERVNEKELCELIGVSRTPIREALKVLAAEGLVELLPNRGSRVIKPSTQEIKNLFSVIASLERLAVETVAQEASHEAIAQLRQLHDVMMDRYKEKERELYFELNHRIHEAIIELARNPVLIRTHQDLMTRARRPRFIAITSDARWSESIKEHEMLMAAIELRESRFAGEILFRHVLRTGEAYIASLHNSSR